MVFRNSSLYCINLDTNFSIKFYLTFSSLTSVPLVNNVLGLIPIIPRLNAVIHTFATLWSFMFWVKYLFQSVVNHWWPDIFILCRTEPTGLTRLQKPVFYFGSFTCKSPPTLHQSEVIQFSFIDISSMSSEHGPCTIHKLFINHSHNYFLPS